MIIPLAPIIVGIIAWAGNKALPAIWHKHSESTYIKIAKDLCDNHNDCAPYHQYAMKGLVPQTPISTGDK